VAGFTLPMARDDLETSLMPNSFVQCKNEIACVEGRSGEVVVVYAKGDSSEFVAEILKLAERVGWR
jgi:hypothetical protein